MKQSTPKSTGLRLLGPGLALGTVVALGWATAILPALTLWDEAWLLSLHRYAAPALDRAMLWLTDLGTVWGVLPGTILLVGILLWQRQRQRARFLFLAMIGALLLNLLLKGIWQRARPNLWDGIPTYPDPSFPSGHATFSLALIVAVVLVCDASPHRRWIALGGGLLAFFIGISRLYLGVHYPSDVIGGWLLAIGWTMGLHRVMFPLPSKP